MMASHWQRPSCAQLHEMQPFLRRHWPVVVAAVADLPRGVAGGGCASAPGVGFPLALADVSAKCKPEEAYPALVMGTQVQRRCLSHRAFLHITLLR